MDKQTILRKVQGFMSADPEKWSGGFDLHRDPNKRDLNPDRFPNLDALIDAYRKRSGVKIEERPFPVLPPMLPELTERFALLTGRKPKDAQRAAVEIAERLGMPQVPYYDGTPGVDTINVPLRGYFDSALHFYDALVHEVGHSTGYQDRFRRRGVGTPSDNTAVWGVEEATAELFGALLLDKTGHETDDAMDRQALFIANVLRGAPNGKDRDFAFELAWIFATGALDYFLGGPLDRKAMVEAVKALKDSLQQGGTS